MPLYRKRFKHPLSQQQPKEDIIPPKLEELSRSETSEQVECFPKFHETLNSPVYPEAFPRNASEPSESAFADDEFGNRETEIDIIPTPVYNAKDIDKLEMCDSQISNENITSIQNSHEDVANNSEEISKIQEVKIFHHSHLKDLSNANKDTTTTDKPSESDLIKNLHKVEQNYIDVDTKSQNKENKIPKEKKSKTDKAKTRRIKNKTKNESQFPHPSDSLNTLDTFSHKSPSSRVQNNSLNSSRSSQMSMNDTNVKEAYKKFMIEKKTIKGNMISSQNSDISLNDPVVKETYSEFMEKKTKFARINTPKGLTHYDKMKWLQKQRNVGVYVHCDHCDKIRYLEDVNDPTFLPDKWYCEDNTDTLFNKCEIPQEKFPLHIQEDWIDNLYNAGSIVWARVEGYPWWPGMVDDDPNTESYYWLDSELNDTPSYYHVTFFDKTEVTRAWLKPRDIKAFFKEKDNPHLLPSNHSIFKKRIDFALKQANTALEMSLQKRLEKFSFLVRYKKPINKPKDATKEDLKRKASKFNKADFVKEKKQRGIKTGKTKKKACKGQKLEPYDSFPTDFEIPPSPTLENISLELFEDI